MIKKIVLQVGGMGCQGCVESVTKKLKAAPGVKEAAVTLQPPEAIVTFDEEKTTLARLIDSTAGTGYPLRLKDELGGE
jgi:copper chaperone CopZ